MSDTTADVTLTAKQGSPKKRPSRVPSTPNQQIQRLAAHWQTLDGTQRGTYEALLRQINALRSAEPGQPTPPFLSAYAVYIQTATAVLAQGLPLPTEAPDQESLAPLPPVRVDASFANGIVSISLVPQTPYLSTVLVYGVKPILPGQDIVSPSAYKSLGAIQLHGTVNISEIYANRFRVTAQGYQINLKLVGVTSGGLKTNALYTEGIALAPPHLALSDGTDDNALPPGILHITNWNPTKNNPARKKRAG